MRRLLALCLLVALLSAALLSVGTGSSAAGMGPVRQGLEGPETIAAAREKIEALPWAFTFTHPPRDTRNALIIRTTDAHERSFRFFLFRGRTPEDIGIPSFHLHNLGGGQVGASFEMFANEGQEIRPETDTLPIRSYQGNSGITKAMEDEYFEIRFAVEDAVCKLSTGKSCPAL